MKKLALAVIATAFIAIGHTPVNAQEPVTPIPDELLVECGESDGRIDEDCVEFYVEALPPITAPPATTTTTTTIVAASPPQGALPRTGGGISPLLGMGAALLVGGGIIVVGTRRRSTATAN